MIERPEFLKAPTRASSFLLQMVVPGAGEHPLQYNYTFWYSRRTPGRPASTQSYEQNIKQIGSFASVCHLCDALHI